jgi:hypothetical protein
LRQLQYKFASGKTADIAVTVADMYDMADLTAPYTANDYGWKSVVNADIVRARDGGWILKLPNARPIN